MLQTIKGETLMTFIEIESGVHMHVIILDYTSAISRGSVLLVEVTIVTLRHLISH